ncbi:MAG: hypothetical protein NUW37_14305 [Planctomycetes bacterium]|nr:hypothetical protein [Planctomycetota bacterium]
MIDDTLLFGQIAISEAIIDDDQLRRALEAQAKAHAAGDRRLIGETLVGEGAMNRESVRRVLKVQSFLKSRVEGEKFLGVCASEGMISEDNSYTVFRCHEMLFREFGELRRVSDLLVEMKFLSIPQTASVYEKLGGLAKRPQWHDTVPIDPSCLPAVLLPEDETIVIDSSAQLRSLAKSGSSARTLNVQDLARGPVLFESTETKAAKRSPALSLAIVAILVFALAYSVYHTINISGKHEAEVASLSGTIDELRSRLDSGDVVDAENPKAAEEPARAEDREDPLQTQSEVEEEAIWTDTADYSLAMTGIDVRRPEERDSAQEAIAEALPEARVRMAPPQLQPENEWEDYQRRRSAPSDFDNRGLVLLDRSVSTPEDRGRRFVLADTRYLPSMERPFEYESTVEVAVAYDLAPAIASPELQSWIRYYDSSASYSSQIRSLRFMITLAIEEVPENAVPCLTLWHGGSKFAKILLSEFARRYSGEVRGLVEHFSVDRIQGEIQCLISDHDL